MTETNTNTVILDQVPYEIDGKTLFTEALERVCDQYEGAFRAFGREWEND